MGRISRDEDSFTNIGVAFRGYDLVLSDPENFQSDPGYRAHIFDEFAERKAVTTTQSNV